MARIFISYRRADSSTFVGRVYDQLAGVFGSKDIFKDVNHLRPGEDFPTVLKAALSTCKVLLVVIGPKWASITDKHGMQRLAKSDDFVRMEVEMGLRQSDVTVIPVLVGGASMPAAADLPSTIQDIVRLQSVQVRDDPDFPQDMNRLIRRLKQLLRRRLLPLFFGSIVVLGLLLIGLGSAGLLGNKAEVGGDIEIRSTQTLAADTATVQLIIPSLTDSLDAAASDTPSTTSAATPAGEIVTTDNNRVSIPGRTYTVRNGLTGETLTVPAFVIDDRETTRAAFNDYLLNAPHGLDGTVLVRLSQAAGQGDGDLPMSNVEPEEAQFYCHYQGGDLPTREQWLVAAGLTSDGVVDMWYHQETVAYPANIDGSLQRTTVAGTLFPPNDIGLYDMVGNVAEWVLPENGHYLALGGDIFTSEGDGLPENVIVNLEALIDDFTESEVTQIDLSYKGFRCIYE
jgi:hypothetical protein